MFDSRSTPSRFRTGVHIMFIVLNPRSASADVIGIVSIKKNEPERRSGFKKKNRNAVPVRSGPIRTLVVQCRHGDVCATDQCRRQ